MKQRPQDPDQRQRHPGDEGSGDASINVEERQARARRLLAAGDEAIRRALSRDSEQFLAHNRQQGGQ